MNRPPRETHVLGVIPARYHSTRFPGKVIAPIAGRPMIQHVWERAVRSRRLDRLVIACDHDEVQAVCAGFGAQVVRTRQDHPSGTDRVFEAAGSMAADIVVNIQGDEPLIDPGLIDGLVICLRDRSGADIATAVGSCRPQERDDPNTVKVVTDGSGRALYFSRSAIPFHRDQESGESVCQKHIGIYAFRLSALRQFCALPPSPLERIEKLEQLRALEAGMTIVTIPTSYQCVGVDSADDIHKVEALMRQVNG